MQHLVFWPHAGAWGAGVILPPCAQLLWCRVVCYEDYTKKKKLLGYSYCSAVGFNPAFISSRRPGFRRSAAVGVHRLTGDNQFPYGASDGMRESVFHMYVADLTTRHTDTGLWPYVLNTYSHIHMDGGSELNIISHSAGGEKKIEYRYSCRRKKMNI